jgi:hypothetical protein
MTSGSPLARIARKAWFVAGLVLLWKMALWLLAALPPPANDSFFYDGPVVSWLLHGRYVNPSLALALPISGTEVFSAYPPLYQGVLLAWMWAFGTSALAAMALHLVLFTIYALLLLAIFRQLGAPAWCGNVAAAFLLALTFHDRPDSLAHVFGMLAVYAWVRSPQSLGANASDARSNRWPWAMAGFAILCLGTSVQIGAVYFLLLCIGMLAASWLTRKLPPLAPLIVMLAVPAALIALVAVEFPHLWAGVLEHARQTPSFTGCRWPQAGEVLKVGRTVPGLLAAAALLAWRLCRDGPPAMLGPRNPVWLVSMASTLAGLAVVAACLTTLTANLVQIAAYLQPLAVAGALALLAAERPEPRGYPPPGGAQTPQALLAAIRALGLTTWGLVCAADAGYGSSLEKVQAALARTPRDAPVVVSAAYLYEAARHREIRAVHSDWLGPARRGDPEADLNALIALKPTRLILTQFDYYRRYQALVVDLSHIGAAEVSVTNAARARTPDSIPSLQRVVQHISWVPVIVDLSWKR